MSKNPWRGQEPKLLELPCDQSVMMWAAMPSIVVHYFLFNPVCTGIYQHIVKDFVVPSAYKLYVDASVCTVKGTKM